MDRRNESEPVRIAPDFFAEGGIYLHTADDRVIWCFRAGYPPCPLVSDASALIDLISRGMQTAFTDLQVPRFRLAGCLDNVPLISGLSRLASSGKVRVDLAAMPVDPYPDKSVRGGVRNKLLGLRHGIDEGMPASLGGWHRLSDQVACSYVLASTLGALGDEPDGEKWIGQFHRHPVFKAWDFLQTGNAYALASILGVILDPRLHISLSHPSRPARLFNRLALTPETFDGVGASKRTTKAKLAYASWACGGEPADITKPNHFLWRWRADRPDRDALRTTQLFIQYIQLVWLDALYRERVPGSEPLFDPNLYFGSIEVADAYRAAVG